MNFGKPSAPAGSIQPRRKALGRFAGSRWWQCGILCLCAAVALPGTTGAGAGAEEAQSYIARSWQAEDGLPHSYVLAMTQTWDGHLWVGTRAGLARFDGMEFTAIEPADIRDMGVSSLCEGDDSSLWVGLETNGLVRLKGSSVWRYHLTNAPGNNYIRVMCKGRDGTIWIGTRGGLTQHRGGRFRNVSVTEGRVNPSVEALCEDATGNLWVGTAGGLHCVSNGVVTTTYTMRDGLPANLVTSLCPDQAGGLWVGTSAGLVRFHDGTFQTVYTEANGLADRFIRTLFEDRKGQLWIGTYGGLYRSVNRASVEGAPTDLRCVAQWTAQGDAFDRVMSLVEDQEGSLWVGSRDGLTRLRTQRISRFGKQQGLSQNSVTAVCADAAGAVWVASWRGGLDRVSDGRVATFSRAQGLGSDMLLSLCPGRDGVLWIGTDHADGLYRFKDGNFTHYDARHGLTNVAIFALHEDRAGNLWIGTARTLTLFAGAQFTNFTAQEGLAGDPVRAVLEDAAGDLWIGTGEGLSRRTNGRFVNYTTRDGLSDNSITALHADAEGNLWIGTAGGGLNRYRNGRFTAYTPRQGLFSEDVLEILEDHAGRLWISYRNGVYCVERRALDDLDAGKIAALTCVAFGKDEGLTGVQCTSAAKPAGCKDAAGRLWFTTSKGLVVISPDFKKNATPPHLVLEQIRADKRVVWPGAWQNPVRIAQSAEVGLGTPPPVRAPPGRGELEFHYAALSFQSPEKNRFRYCLEGVDDDWVDAGTRRVAYYNRVPPGQYRFRVQGCNNHGVWSEAEVVATIEVQPHFWQAWWFQGLALAAGIGLVAGGAAHWTRKAAQQRLARLEQQHALEQERARIARDIHDDLGSSLTRIAMLSELTEADKAEPAKVETHVRKIAASARETVRSLDEIVWAVSPQHDTWNSLVGYLSEFAHEFFEGTNVRSRLEMPLDLPSDPLLSEVRHGLFLVIKEALTNSLKHARAHEVRLRLAVQDARVQIQITDDGCGFDLDRRAAASGGNGLRNMRARIASLGGQLRIESAPGRGTSLTIDLALKGQPAAAQPEHACAIDE